MAAPNTVTTSNPLTLGDNNTDGVILGGSATKKIGFYGTTPIVQRAGAMQATSYIGTATSSAVGTNLNATVIEIMSTLIALGLWKGSA